MIPVVVLTIVFFLIAVRRIGTLRLQIWQIMLGGALVVVLTGSIAPLAALRSINLDVLVFLLGMFLVGQAMEESGYLAQFSYTIFRRAQSPAMLLAATMLVMGGLSALLMNDTMAIIGTPVVLSFARKAGIRPQFLLMTLALSVTIGGVVSPIGNPQNLLVALSGELENPFVTFGRHLLAPSALCMAATYGILRLVYRREFHALRVVQERALLTDPALVRLCRVSLWLMVVVLVAKVSLVFLDVDLGFRLTYVALAGALPLLLSKRRVRLVRRVDWTTLLFFAAMFVVMESVWRSGFVQSAIEASAVDPSSPAVVIGVSILGSQLVSNVPLVALYLPLLQGVDAGTASYMALAAGATMAGTLTILGAASNVIIVQNAERRSGETLSLVEFLRAGLPVTAVCSVILWLFLV